MAITWPVTADALSNPAASDALNNVTTPHATQHSNVNDILEAIEAYLGTNASQTTPTGANRVLASSSGTASTWTATPTLTSLTATTLTCQGIIYGNDSSNAKMTLGMTLNQGANDDEIISLKSSDTAHGITTETETDTYGALLKAGGIGGIQLSGYTGTSVAIALQAVEVTNSTVHSTIARGAITMHANKKSGTAAGAMDADSNMLAVTNNGTTRFILDADGDSHQDVGTAWTNYAHHDDHELLCILSAHVTRHDDPVRHHFGAFLSLNRGILEEAKLVSFNDGPGQDGHPFVNMSKLTMLLTGAVIQAGNKIRSLEQDLAGVKALLAPGA